MGSDAVRVEGSRTLRNSRYLRKYTRFQPQQFEVVPVEKEMEKQANAPVPEQVTRGRVVGEGRVEDPVPDQVVRGPVGGGVPDARDMQPGGSYCRPKSSYQKVYKSVKSSYQVQRLHDGGLSEST